MGKFVVDSKGNPFENLEEMEYFYLNLALNISGYCNGDYDAKLPCSKEEWDSVIHYETEKEISKESSLTNWLEVHS